MDVTMSKPIESKTSNLATTTVPVRYIVEESEDGDHTGGESCAEVETYQLNEIYTTDDDENKNCVYKSANSDFSTSQQSADSVSESEISLCQLTNKDKFRDSVIEPTREDVAFRGDDDSPLSNGVVLTPRYSAPTNTVPSFRLSIPSIEEVKESGSDGGETDPLPSPSPMRFQQNMNSNNLQVKNKATQERRSSFAAGEIRDQKQSRPLRRRFSISVSSSDDESSSSSSESEEQRKIEKYLQSRQRRRHSAATTSNELLQAVSVLMGSGRRGSGKGSSLFPMLANALVNLANSGGLQNDSEDEPKQQRKSCPDAPIIRVSRDGECTCHCGKRPVSPKDLLTRPYSPTGSDNDKKDCKGSPKQDSKQRLDAEIEVLRILTTRSPAVSENDDSDSDLSQERPPRRRRSKTVRKSSLRVPEMKSSQARRSSIGAIPLQTHHLHRANKTKTSVLPSSKSQSTGSSSASLTTPSRSRRSSFSSSLSITPPSSKTQSRRSSLSKHDSETSLAEDLRQRLEKTATHQSPSHGTVQPPTSQKTSSNNSLAPERAGSRLSNRRASMCVPATHNFAANPPASKEEEEEIRLRATLRGRRRSSWAGAGAPPPLVAQIRAASPMTLLRESNYYGKLHTFSSHILPFTCRCPLGQCPHYTWGKLMEFVGLQSKMDKFFIIFDTSNLTDPTKANTPLEVMTCSRNFIISTTLSNLLQCAMVVQ